MLTLQDCIGFTGLTPEQIEAIAEHEHLGMILATEWAECILDRPNGCDIVQCVLADEVEQCRAVGDMARCKRYESCLDDFVRTHQTHH